MRRSGVRFISPAPIQIRVRCYVNSSEPFFFGGLTDFLQTAVLGFVPCCEQHRPKYIEPPIFNRHHRLDRNQTDTVVVTSKFGDAQRHTARGVLGAYCSREFCRSPVGDPAGWRALSHIDSRNGNCCVTPPIPRQHIEIAKNYLNGRIRLPIIKSVRQC